MMGAESMRVDEVRNRVALPLLYFLAVFAPLAHLANSTPMKAVATATQAAPAMKVFTSHDGYETFSPRFHLEWTSHGIPQSLELTPKVYSAVKGPYNRRNAYGAALAYAPVLAANPATRQLHSSVVRYALCDPAPVLSELGVDHRDPATTVTVHIEPRRPLAPEWQLRYEVTCDE